MRARWSGNEAHQRRRGRTESQRVSVWREGEMVNRRGERREMANMLNNVLGTMDDDSLVRQEARVWEAHINYQIKSY